VSEATSGAGYVATAGGCINLASDEVQGADAWCRYGRSELESVSIGHRRQRLAGPHQSRLLDRFEVPPSTSDSAPTPW
jgi:hypothetical protein